MRLCDEKRFNKIFFVGFFIVFCIINIFQISTVYASDCSVGLSEHPLLDNKTYKLHKEYATENVKLNDTTHLYLEYGGCTALGMSFKFVVNDKETLKKLSDNSHSYHYSLAVQLLELMIKKKHDFVYSKEIKQTFDAYHKIIPNPKLGERLSLLNEEFPNTLTLETKIKNNKTVIVNINLGVNI